LRWGASSIRYVEFDQFTVVLLLTPPGAPALDDEAAAQLQDAHLNYLATLHEQGKLLAAGPLPGEPRRRFRGLNIFGTDPEEARELAGQDPAVQAGQFELAIMPWLIPAGAVNFEATRFPHSAAETES
jgi:uncharacterized protein YciI